MADTITLIAQDEQAAEIMDAFERETGLVPEDGDDETRVYEIEGADHEIEIVQTLNDIDEDWSEHLSIGPPA